MIIKIQNKLIFFMNCDDVRLMFTRKKNICFLVLKLCYKYCLNYKCLHHNVVLLKYI